MPERKTVSKQNLIDYIDEQLHTINCAKSMETGIQVSYYNGCIDTLSILRNLIIVDSERLIKK